MSEKHDEMQFLENLTKTYVTSESPQDRLIKSFAVQTFLPYMDKYGSALEFGCSDGFMTSLILPLCQRLTVVDGSKTFIDIAKTKVSSEVTFIHSLFEDYSPSEKFDYIFATYVLEHVEDAVNFLRHAGSLLTERGRLFIVVPNARAFSRQLARHMGLLNNLYDLTKNDISHGHRRVYDRVLLNRDVEEAGLKQIAQGGILLKPLADFQMDKLIETEILGESHIKGLYKMGQEYPDFAGSLFAVCRQK